MQIQKEYTKDGIRLIHPSGVIAVTTLDVLYQMKEQMQNQIKRSEEQCRTLEIDIATLESLN